MIRLELSFDGSIQDFENALCEKDDSFYLIDSLIYELDYGQEEGEQDGIRSVHRTKYGDITIKVGLDK